MTYYHMYVIQIFIIRCAVSEILAEIDYKGPNWTFLTLTMTSRVIPSLAYFRTGFLCSTLLLLNNIKKLHTRNKEKLSDSF